MNIQDLTTFRLRNQSISGKKVLSPLEITQKLGALQAQDYYGSLWALGLRTGMTEQEIIGEIEAKSIIRTWPQRGTLHFVSAADAKWQVSLSAERLLRGATTRRKQLGLDDSTLAKSQSILTRALTDGNILTRPQAMQLLEEADIATDAGRGYHILWYLSQSGVTYIGPMAAKQQTIGLLDEITPQGNNRKREDGIAELARRYFTSHGPATLQDFMWWSGLTSADGRNGLEANQALLVKDQFEGKDYWSPKDSAAQTASGVGSYLLPGFDEYMLGYKDRSAALHADHANKIIPGGNGMFLSTIIIGGQVSGTWKRQIKPDHVVIHLTPFRHLTKVEAASLVEPAEAYGKFLGLPYKFGQSVRD